MLFCGIIALLVICFWYNFIIVKPNILAILKGFIPSFNPTTNNAMLSLFGSILNPQL